MKIARITHGLILIAIAGVSAACGTASPFSTPSLASISCAAKAEPTALEITPDSGIAPPKAVHRVDPVAPSHLTRGEAIIDAVIGEDGRPRHICLRTGDPEWGQAAATAFQNWQFEPATMDGKPVAVLFTLTTRLNR
jgi:hypothetical protein